jgi:hypothetical protein
LLAFNGFKNAKRNDYFNKDLGLILEDKGYGFHTIKYADGKTRDFFQIGLSANKTGKMTSIFIPWG